MDLENLELILKYLSQTSKENIEAWNINVEKEILKILGEKDEQYQTKLYQLYEDSFRILDEKGVIQDHEDKNIEEISLSILGKIEVEKFNFKKYYDEKIYRIMGVFKGKDKFFIHLIEIKGVPEKKIVGKFPVRHYKLDLSREYQQFKKQK